jgi:hypothetical protein
MPPVLATEATVATNTVVRDVFVANGYKETQPGVYENTEEPRKVDANIIEASLRLLIGAVRGTKVTE